MVIVKNDWFELDGVRCDTVGLSCDTPPVPPMAAQSYTEWSTGADSPYSSADDTFSNVAYALNCRVFGKPDDFDNTEIYNFIANAKTLKISRLSGYHFKIRSIDGIVPTQKNDGQVIGYKVKFTLAPFKYHDNNDEVKIENNSITNIGNRYSRPIYRISGYQFAEFYISVNGQVLNFTKPVSSSHGDIFVDTERMLVYTADGTNLMPQCDGILPFLKVGKNLLSVSGQGGTLYVTGNWRSF